MKMISNASVLIAIFIVIFIVAGGGVYLATKKDAKTNTTDTSSVSTGEPSSSSTTTDNSPTAAEATVITYSNSGFTPNTITIKAGDPVTVKNESSRTLDFASDDHPTHKNNSELNVGDIESGKSATFTMKAGTWGYHNHLNASDTGTIIVQ